MSDVRTESVLRRLAHYLVLPSEISPFEASYLRRMNRIALVFFAVHIPAMVVIAWANGTGPVLAALLTTAVVAGPALAYSTLSNPRAISVTHGVAAMFMGGLLVHFGQGPVQIEMHFYFFALLAMLAVFGNPVVVLAAAVTVAIHHLALWFFLPASVFNYDAPVWVVAIHAAFVVLVSSAGCFIARSFFDNVIGLTKIVSARTAELDGRNRDLRLVLDNVAQGFTTIDRRGVPSAECSLAFQASFGASREGETVFDQFGRVAPTFSELSAMSWVEVADGVMPLALTLDQMPHDLVVGETSYRVAYVPIGEGETPDRFLVVVTDVTAETQRRCAEALRREEMLLFERLLANRNVVHGFFDEGDALVNAISDGKTTDLVALKRMLHTLKGNSAIFGLGSLAELCHELETHVAEEGTPPPEAQLAKLRERWSSLSADVERLLGKRDRSIQIDEAQYAALEGAVRRGAHGAPLLTMVQALKLEITGKRLDHFAEQTRRIADRLGKGVDVRVESDDGRFDPRRWNGFWGAFIHAIRNAVDHGLESNSERVSMGKPPNGRVTLRTFVRDERFVVEISDDGRGMDWGAIALKAKELGIPAETQADLQAALFQQGISTAAQVTDVSGRGIGMGAVHAATKELGGRLEINTTAGRGTTVRMTFPRGAMSADLSPPQTSVATMAAFGA